MSCGVGSDLALLWPWHRLAAIAPMRPLAWEPPALEKTKKTKKKKEKKLHITGGRRKKSINKVKLTLIIIIILNRFFLKFPKF